MLRKIKERSSLVFLIKFMKKIVVPLIVIVIVVFGGYLLWRQFSFKPTLEQKTPEKEEFLKIGVMLPLTGDAAAYGIPLQRAAQIAVEEINSQGGISGKKIEIIWEDSKCDAASGAAAAQKLVNVNKVKYIMGGACSSETLAAAPITEEAKVIMISPSATSPDITKAGDFLFRTAPSDALAGRVAANYAFESMKARKAAIISEKTDYAQGLRKIFKERFEELGGKIVLDEQYETGATDFRTQILKMKNAKPDLLYLVPQTPTSGILVLKQMKDQKLELAILTAEVLIGRDVISENKALTEGIIGFEQFFDESNPFARTFIETYKARYQEELAFPSFMSNIYSQFYLLKEAIEKVGDDPVKVRDYLYQISNWQHALGSLTFDQNGDPLSVYAIKKVKDGTLEQIDVVKP
jgi:branched-chain amino acid transport system substrate-binding protein